MKTLRLTVHVVSDDRTRWIVSSKILADAVADMLKRAVPGLTTGPVPAIAVRVEPPKP